MREVSLREVSLSSARSESPTVKRPASALTQLSCLCLCLCCGMLVMDVPSETPFLLATCYVLASSAVSSQRLKIQFEWSRAVFWRLLLVTRLHLHVEQKQTHHDDHASCVKRKRKRHHTSTIGVHCTRLAPPDPPSYSSRNIRLSGPPSREQKERSGKFDRPITPSTLPHRVRTFFFDGHP